MSYTTPTSEHQHSAWIKTLGFYEDELALIEKRLTELAGKNTQKEVSANIEHFQNQVVVQRNNIDEFKHRINEHTHEVFVDISNHAGKVEESKISEHKQLESSVNQLEKVINDLRQEFNAFASTWM